LIEVPSFSNLREASRIVSAAQRTRGDGRGHAERPPAAKKAVNEWAAAAAARRRGGRGAHGHGSKGVFCLVVPGGETTTEFEDHAKPQRHDVRRHRRWAPDGSQRRRWE
jgi:hypothetical protein